MEAGCIEIGEIGTGTPKRRCQMVGIIPVIRSPWYSSHSRLPLPFRLTLRLNFLFGLVSLPTVGKLN